MIDNPGLLANVASFYRSLISTENLISPRLVENFDIEGKKGKKYTVDIYFEFVQMNNREITIIKTISGREIVENDIWEFYCVLQDLKIKAKGILYYEKGSASKTSIEYAGNCCIEIKKFELTSAIIEFLSRSVKEMLPDDKIIGDPFWALMYTEDNGISQTNGNFFGHNGTIPLFFSMKQARIYCELINKKCDAKLQVFGISQNHLRKHVELLKGLGSPFHIGLALPRFKQSSDGQLSFYEIDLEKLLKYYYRGDSYE